MVSPPFLHPLGFGQHISMEGELMAEESIRRNVLLITCDQMRGDCIGYEHPVVETPTLDFLTREGKAFSRAYSAVPSCIAARAGILTGMAPQSHGRVGYRDGVPWRYPHTLPGIFAANGYHTQGIGKMHFYPSRSLQGFHNVALHDGYLHHGRRFGVNYEQNDDYLKWLREKKGSDQDLLDHGLNCNSWVARPWHLEERYHPTNWVVSESIDFLRRRDPDKPFFLWMSFVRPHPPFDPPQVFLDQYLDAELPASPMGNWALQDDPDDCGRIPDTRKGMIETRALQRAKAAYFALITHMDHQIGRFLEQLRETGEFGRTVVLFTSDHGELLGDHNLFRKALPYEGSARVPFILRVPGERPSTRFDRHPVELQDVMPTLLDSAGLDIPDTADGRSVLPLYRQEQTHWRSVVHGEHAYGDDSNHFLVDQDRKYIWFSQSGKEQLFDLAEDPSELCDLAEDPNYSQVLEAMRQELIRRLADREEGYSDGQELIAGRTPKPCLNHIL